MHQSQNSRATAIALPGVWSACIDIGPGVVPWHAVVATRACLVTQLSMPGTSAQPLLLPTSCACGAKALASVFRNCQARRPLACAQTRCHRQDAADISLEEAATQLRPPDAVLDSGVASTSGTDQAVSFLPDFQTVPYTHRGGCAVLHTTVSARRVCRCLCAAPAAKILERAVACAERVRGPKRRTCTLCGRMACPARGKL